MRRATAPTATPVSISVAAARRAAARRRLAASTSAGCRSTCSTPTSPENAPAERAVTDRLYGGDREHRLRAGDPARHRRPEGARAPSASTPEVFHTNEGHAGFLGIERIRAARRGAGPRPGDGASRPSARAPCSPPTRPCPAGIDRFPRDARGALLRRRRRAVRPADRATLLDLGAEPGGDPARRSTWRVLGIRLAGARERRLAAARRGRRGRCSPTSGRASSRRGADRPRDERRPRRDLGGAGDGGALPTARLGDGYGQQRPRLDARWRSLRRRALGARDASRARLVPRAQRLRRRGRHAGCRDGSSRASTACSTRDALTIGFARRVATYKRLTLMLRDPERLERLLLDPERPVQFVFAGKAHPADDEGKAMIAELVRVRRPAGGAAPDRVPRGLRHAPSRGCSCQGVDVWLNNPRGRSRRAGRAA